jgi:hypothetical protein
MGLSIKSSSFEQELKTSRFLRVLGCTSTPISGAPGGSEPDR